MSDGKQVVALKSFVYSGEVREKDEIFSMIGARNDYSMLKFRHCREVESNDSEVRCDGCVKTFATQMGIEMHYMGRIHPQSPNFHPDGRTKKEGPQPRVVTQTVAKSGAGQVKVPGRDVPIFGG